MSETLLVIFNGMISEARLLSAAAPYARVCLFPLTDDSHVTEAMDTILTKAGKTIELANAPLLIDTEIQILRERLPGWSAGVGDMVVGGKTIRERFLSKDGQMSGWWFSLLSEKNPLKTDFCLRLAQLQAAEKFLEASGATASLLALSDRCMKNVLKAICRRRFVVVTGACVNGRSGGFKQLIKNIPVLGDVFAALQWIVIFSAKARRVRKEMGPLKNRRKFSNAVLFVSYFPAVDQAAAAKGVFRNRYLTPLHDYFHQSGRGINWLLMTVPYENMTFSDAAKLGKRFHDSGEAVYFLEEFLGPLDIVACVFLWLRQAFRGWFVAGLLGHGALAKEFTLHESERVLRDLWNRSFAGSVGVSGIFMYEIYKRVFEYFDDASHCVYYLEMQGWEKALNAARQGRTKALSVGFQHSSFSRNHFSYFHDKSEIATANLPGRLPLPDVVASNGDRNMDKLKKWGYPTVQRLEAVRHFYLKPFLESARPVKKKPPVVLLVGAYEPSEAESLLLMLTNAFPGVQDFEIWIKPHPAAPVKSVVPGHFVIKTDLMHTLLPEVSTVIVGESSVALDALAFGCRVIAPILGNAVFMNPLGDEPTRISKVYNPTELKQAVLNSFKNTVSATEFSDAQDFVKSYWHIDETLNDWKNLLGAAKAS